jgi:hypothetical protein
MVGLLMAPIGARGDDGPAVSGADRTAIVEIISRQLEAFQRDDGEQAFSYASPTIQGMFGSPANFMQMVRDGYAPVYRPRGVKFLDLTTIDSKLTQRVLLVGPDGAAVMALYFMQQQRDGSWRINGCVLVKPPGEGV